MGSLLEEQEAALNDIMVPRADVESEPVEQHPFLEGIPLSMPDGMGRGFFDEQSENAQSQPKQVWRDTLNQSAISSAVEYFQTTPDAVSELLETGTAELEPLREELTKDIPLHLQDNIMSSLTVVGARARRARILEDVRVQNRLAQQTGITNTAVMLAGGLLDADLPLMFASGGTLAAARTAANVAKAAKFVGAGNRIARVAGDAAVGVSGGALSGLIVGGVSNITRDDYDVNGLFQTVLAAAATGGVLNPAFGTIMPDRGLWSDAAKLQMRDEMGNLERSFQQQMIDPDSALNRATSPVDEIDITRPRAFEIREDGSLGDEISVRGSGGFDYAKLAAEGEDASAWAYEGGVKAVDVVGIGSGKDRFLEDADLINQSMDDIGMSDATRIGEGNSKVVFGTETEVARVYYGRPDIAVRHPRVAAITQRRQVGMSEYNGRPLQTTGVTIDKLERVTPLTEEEARDFLFSGELQEWAEEQFKGTSITLEDYNPANFGRRPNGDLVVFDGVSATAPEDLIEDLSYKGSIGAASLGTSGREIDVETNLANLEFNKTAGPNDGLRDVDPVVQELHDAGAPPSVIRTSIASREWRNDYDFDALYAADTADPWVRTLVGGSEFKVRIPYTEVDVPIGQIAGTVFTLGQRDFTSLVHSRAPSANFVAAEILESASGLTRRGSSAAVLREMFHSSSMVHSAETLVNSKNAYFKANGLNPVRLESHRQFTRNARLAMDEFYRTGKRPAGFEDLIDSLDKTHLEILEHMKGLSEDVSVRGARDIEHKGGYFRYDWEPKHFLRVREQAGEAAMIQAFRDGYMKASGLDADLAEKLSRAIVRRFSDRALGVGAADARLLDIDSRSGIEAVLEQSGLPAHEIESIMRRLDVNTQERAQKGFLKHRTDVDLRTPIPNTNLQIVDLMTDDLERSVQQYVGDAAGSAALAHKGLRDNADVNQLKDAIMFEQSALGDAALTRPQLDAIFSQFTGGAHKGMIMGYSTEGVSPVASMLTKATRASLLQRVGLTQLMDTANLVVANGLANSMEPIMARLGFNKVGKMNKVQLQNLHGEIESLGVIVGQDHMLFRPHLSIDETEVANNVYMQAAQSGLNTVERATNYASGQIHVTQMQQMVASAATTTNIMRTLAGQDTNLTPRMLRDIGLEDDKISELYGLIQDGVIKVDGGRVELNSAQWSPELRLEFGAAITRTNAQQVQKGLIGETSVWMNTDIGKLLSSLKTFGLTAVQKQTARNIMIGGKPHFLHAAAWQLGFAYSVLSLSQAIQGNEMGAVDRARLAVAYTPTMGTIPMIVDPVTTMLGFDDLNFSPYGRYSSFLDSPVFEQTQKLLRSPGALADMVSGTGDYDDMKNAQSMFFLNWYGMKRVWEEM